jgi:hypothetical protein
LPPAERFVRTISGSSPSEWLISATRRFIDTLRGNVEFDEGSAALGREQVRADIQKLSESARFILKQFNYERRSLRQISDPRKFQMREMLMSKGEADLPYLWELVIALRFLEGRCDEKLKALPTSQGGARPKPDIVTENAPDAHTLCALMVIVLWERQTGKQPGVNRPEAQLACAQLWEAAGGMQRTNSRSLVQDRGNSAWRDSLEIARDRWLDGRHAETLRDAMG